jgi:molybdenum cofactor cytidylyltransferase
MSGIGLLMLAAGGSRRMGSAKQLLPFRGMPLVAHSLAQLQAAGGRRAHLVVGEQAEAVAAACLHLQPWFPLNADWALGMGASLAAGMRHLLAIEPDVVGVLIALADQPHVSAAHYAQLLQLAAENPDLIVAAHYEGHLGVPIVLPRKYFEVALAAQGDVGLRKWLTAMAEEVLAVAMPEAAWDWDSPEDVARWGG